MSWIQCEVCVKNLFPVCNKENLDVVRDSYVWRAVITGFFLLAGMVFIVQQFDFEFATTHGLVVPDSVNMTQTLEYLWDQGNQFDHDSGFFAIAAIYGWTWLLHPSLCFAVNGLLMLFNLSLFRRVVITQLEAPTWSVLGLLANPYLILVMPGPNKEIPLLFLTLCILEALFRIDRKWCRAVVLCFPVYLLRDGYGLFILLVVGMLRMLRCRERLLPIVFLMLMLMIAIGNSWLTVIPVLERNNDIFSALSEQQEAVGSLAQMLALDPSDPIGGVFLYGLRLVYNLVSLAFFPVFLTGENNFYWIGAAYWVYGLLSFLSWLGCAWGWMSTGEASRHQKLAACLALCTLYMISLSLFVQPRYLMPMLPVAFGVFAASSSNVRMACAVIGLGLVAVVMSYYSLLGRSSPAATPDIVAPPAYIL